MSDPTPMPTLTCEPWASIDDFPDGCPCRPAGGSGDDDPAPTDADLNALLADATDAMFSLLGQPKLGECTVTIHPERDGTGCWRRWTAGRGMEIGHAYQPDLVTDGVLLGFPVSDVTEVIVAGEVVDPSDYQLVDGQWLVRLSTAWPAGDALDDDAFAITYVEGAPVPGMVKAAVVEIANELWRDTCGHRSKIPQSVEQMTVQSTSYRYRRRGAEETAQRVKEAGSNLGRVWFALSTYNPTGLRVPTLVHSPDAYQNRVVRTFS